MSAVIKFAEKVKNNFIKAAELLRLKFAFLKSRKKYALSISAVLILVAIGLIIPHGPANAGLIDWIGTGLLTFGYLIVYYIFFVLFYIAYLVAWIGAGVLNINLNPAIINTVLDQSPGSPLYQGWTIFRDIANLFFILILLFIAIGTIVRSQSYNLKSLLPKLIIAVFLINFSNVIAGAIIDFGNIFMYGVLKWMSCPSDPECFSNFFSGLMTVVDDLYGTYKLEDGFTASAEATVGIMVATIYTFLYGLILLALGAFLLIRIAAFAILIILSPLLAFTGEVFPGLQELSSKWWKNLINYTLFGPIFALLLYVSGLMTQQKISVYAPSFFSSNPELGTFGTLYVTIIQNIIPLIFLLAIIPITRELGIAGANAVISSVGGLAKSVGASAFGHVDRFMARGAGKTGTGVYAKLRRGLSTVSYGAYKRGKKAHDADREKDYDIATGAARNRIEKATFGDTQVDYEKRARDARAEVDIKARGITVSDDIIDEAQNAVEKGVIPEIHIKDLKTLAADDAIDDFLERTVDKSTGNAYGRGPEALRKYLHDTFGETGTGYKNLNEKELSKISSVISDLEKKKGNVSYEGVGVKGYNAQRRETVYGFNPNGFADYINPETGATVPNPATGANYTNAEMQEDLQVKAGNKLDPKDLKKSSFLDKNNEISNAGERILSDMKGRRADRIKTMDRDRVVEIDRALTSKYQAVALPGQSPILACQAANPELATAWGELKTQHNL